MNRKFVNGLLLLSLATVGCGTFTSCKDTDEDFKNEILQDQKQMYDKLKAAIDAIKQCNCPDYLKTEVDKMWQYLQMENNPNANITDFIAGYINPILKNYVTNDKLTQELSNYVSKTDSEYVKMGTDIAAIMKALNEGKDTETGTTGFAFYDQLIQDVLDNKANIELMKAAINNRLNSLITSMEVNQTYNYFFGTINLPIGLQSNILANYYYEADADVEFPFSSTNIEILNKEAVADASDAVVETVKFEAGKVYMKDDLAGNNIGQLYVNINPSYINYAGQPLELVKSNGEVAPVKLTVNKTDEVLDFGWTRAEENNGFYRVDAEADPAQVAKLGIRIEEGLKSAFADALKNHTKQDLVQLGKVILGQMDGFLPAYGLKASWTNSEDILGAEAINSVYSKYEIAATTFRPLSYEFMQGQGTSKRLPTFGPASEALERYFEKAKNKLTIDLGFKEIQGFTLNIGEFSVENQYLAIEIPSLTINSNTQTVAKTIYLTYDKGTGAVGLPDGTNMDDVQASALNGLIDSIVKSVNDMLGSGETVAANSIKAQVDANVKKMVDDINKQIADAQANVNKKIQDVLDKIYNKLAGKMGYADKFVTMYNKLAGYLNRVLADPNHYIQVMMAYEGVDGDLHLLSNNANDPSIVGNAGAIELFATSFTGDIVAPSFKKFVGLFDTDNKLVNTSNVFLNKVLPGDQNRVAIDLSTLTAGKTYKIVYSSLDYRGKTSTQVYYLHVK